MQTPFSSLLHHQITFLNQLYRYPAQAVGRAARGVSHQPCHKALPQGRYLAVLQKATIVQGRFFVKDHTYNVGYREQPCDSLLAPISFLWPISCSTVTSSGKHRKRC